MVKKKKRIKFLWWLIILFFLSILLYNITEKIVHSKKEVVVPNITNKPVYEALDVVSKMNLGLKKIGEVYSPNYPVGTVVSQQPQAGMVVREGRTINVVVSLGGEKVFVPNIVGEERRKAEVILRQYTLFIGTVTERYSLKFAKNKIIQQQPQEGEIVDKNTPVNIVVSLGFPPEDVILMPDFKNKNVNEVYQWSKKYGFEINVKEEIVDVYNDGEVIEQQPLPDEIVNNTTIIEIVIAKNKGLTKEKQIVYNFEYELPFLGDTPKNVKIVQISAEGEDVLYNRPTLPKQKIQLFVPPKKNSRIRIFVDGVLIDEK
jgi:beta-lactam-binding protein with PASTA domain